MDSATALAAAHRALAAQDPELPQLLVQLINAVDAPPAAPPHEGALTYPKLTAELRGRAFQARPPAERAALRRARWAAAEAPDAEVPLPPRLQAHSLLMALWTDPSPYARATLLQCIATVPLVWGPWRALKRIFKEAEAAGDYEVYGALAARIDAAKANRRRRGEVTHGTLAWLSRRAWRNLRRLATALPAAWPDAAVAVLQAYDDDVSWPRTWLANHLFFHGTKAYSRRVFNTRKLGNNLIKHRAYPDLWQRSPRPLLRLLETARSERARQFAVDSLKSDFRAALREVEPAWVERLIGVESAVVHRFAIWLLESVPRFSQAAFRELGLHGPVLALLDSPADEARAYAAAYARTHGRDLPLDDLLRLANNDHDAVRKLARDLLVDRDPRRDVGLEGWGRLLGTEYGHDLAAAAIRKHFGARELSPAWFRARLLSEEDDVFTFATDLLVKLHPPDKLGAAFFCDLVDDPELTDDAAEWSMDVLGRFPADAIDVEWARRALLNPKVEDRIAQWVDLDRVPAKSLGAELLKAVAVKADWEANAWLAALVRSGPAWARELEFSEERVDRALKWLGDVRRFSPSDLGFEWLLNLVKRREPSYHRFASDTLTRAFVPADFAPQEAAAPAEAGPADLGGKSFLFTGKLATMTRSEAEKKVTATGGANASGVTVKLDYLVVGDEGSPLYGQGKKGSKQVAAEKLMAKGAELKIISETAFLQMLAGEQRSFSADQVGEGCERLWAMATGPGPEDAPLARFARSYLRKHHNGLSIEDTTRPVDPGAEVPDAFLTFARIGPLLSEARAEVRAFGLDLARFELARLAPPLAELARLHAAAQPDVRAFLERALLADSSREHDLYRLPASSFSADGVYRFCESLNADTRAVGLRLLAAHPQLAVPSELFRLTESPDRSVRAFAIRRIWSQYRSSGPTSSWSPSPLPEAVLRRARAEARPAPPRTPPRPADPPATESALGDLLRQVLFTLPPGRAAALSSDPAEDAPKLRPLPNRKAKLALVETLRDLAVEDGAFAAFIQPLFQTFLASQGASERAAVLVALTRIHHAHPALSA